MLFPDLVEKYIPDSKSQMERERVGENSDEPLTCIHARVYHFFSEMLSQLGQMLPHQVFKLKKILLYQWQTYLFNQNKIR